MNEKKNKDEPPNSLAETKKKTKPIEDNLDESHYKNAPKNNAKYPIMIPNRSREMLRENDHNMPNPSVESIRTQE